MNPTLINTIFLILILCFLNFYLFMHKSSPVLQWNINKYNYSQSKVRIYCLIITAPQHLNTRARAIHSTWASRCDGHSFVTEYSNNTKGLPIASIANITPGYEHLTQKSVLAFLYAYKKFRNDYDWFVKADDDTYLFVENLKYFLRDKNPSHPVTFGQNFKVIVEGGYHSGGGSYVLSRESVKRFYQAHQNPNTICKKDGGSEDIEIAKCLRTVKVYPGKSVDENNRERFHSLSFIDHFTGHFPDWLDEYAETKPATGKKCCSNTTISFHYVTPEEIYLIDNVRYGFNKRR